MLDLLLIPAVALLAFALRAVRRGDHRLHGHLMTAGFTVAAIRMALHPIRLTEVRLAASLAILGLAATTILLGRRALAWREGRSHRAGFPRLHRAAGALTLVAATFALSAWLLRSGR